MKNENIKPVYQIQTQKTEAVPVNWEGIDPICAAVKNGWAVLWQHHAVFTGHIHNGQIEWLNGQPETGDSHLVRLRAFNETVEFHFWRTSQGVKGRKRTDGHGQAGEFIETDMVLRGIVATHLLKLNEFSKSQTVVVCTRNYIEYHLETNQANYVDSRFVNFFKK